MSDDESEDSTTNSTFGIDIPQFSATSLAVAANFNIPTPTEDLAGALSTTALKVLADENLASMMGAHAFTDLSTALTVFDDLEAHTTYPELAAIASMHTVAFQPAINTLAAFDDLGATLSTLQNLDPELATATASVASAAATPSAPKRTRHDTTWDPDTALTHPTSKARTQGIDPVDAFSASLIAYASVPNYSELDEREQQFVAFVIGGVLTFGTGFLLLDPVTAAKLGFGGGTAASLFEAGRIGRKERLTED